MKHIFLWTVTLCILVAVFTHTVSARDALFMEDAEFLIRSVAAEYPDIQYAARVGIVAVILNRVESVDYPNTAAGVISAYRNADGSHRFTVRALADVEEGSRARRMTRDAYLAVVSGADITEGALNFEFVDEPDGKLDLDFDDVREDEGARKMREKCKKYKLVTGGVGFW